MKSFLEKFQSIFPFPNSLQTFPSILSRTSSLYPNNVPKRVRRPVTVNKTGKYFLNELGEFKKESDISREDMAMVALASKNSQKERSKDEKESFRYVERLGAQWAQDEATRAFTQGLIYNATGSAISLVSCRQWGGSLVSNPYPLRIENGQWGMFIQKQDASDSCGGSGALVYEALSKDGGNNLYWCIAWRSEKYESKPTPTNVHVKLVGNVDWHEHETNTWKSVSKAIQKTCLLHKANQEGLYSIITASYGPHAVFEALLTLEHL